MAAVEKVSVDLTRDQLRTLRKAVEDGDYATTSEAVREAVRDWQAKRDLLRAESEGLRQLWDEGLASGPASAIDTTALRDEARRRLAAARKDAGGGRD